MESEKTMNTTSTLTPAQPATTCARNVAQQSEHVAQQTEWTRTRYQAERQRNANAQHTQSSMAWLSRGVCNSLPLDIQDLMWHGELIAQDETDESDERDAANTASEPRAAQLENESTNTAWSERYLLRRTAMILCDQCPVQADCLAFQTLLNTRYGVCGGLDQLGRRFLLHRAVEQGLDTDDPKAQQILAESIRQQPHVVAHIRALITESIRQRSRNRYHAQQKAVKAQSPQRNTAKSTFNPAKWNMTQPEFDFE